MGSSSCAPPPKQSYLCIGQDLFSIDNYVREQYNYSLHHHHHNAVGSRTRIHHQESSTTNDADRSRALPSFSDYFPAAVMSYTDIQKLTGLEQPADYGSGIEYAGMLDDESSDLWQQHHDDETPALQLGLWLNGSQGCRDIINGSLDANIHRLFQILANRGFHTFLRIGYEFDNPSFGYADDPVAYRQAFRVMVDSCRRHVKRCRERISFVWHSWAASESDLAVFYPGDDVVDWIGVSLFLQLYRPDNATSKFVGNTGGTGIDSNATTTDAAAAGGPMNPMVQRVLDFAKAHDKPIMIAESTPFGGIDKLKDPWESWFEPVLSVIDDYDVGMFCYISCDWDSQPMWRNAGFGDSRLTTNATVMRLWRERIVTNSRFQARGDSCSHDASKDGMTMLGEIGPSYAIFKTFGGQHSSRGAAADAMAVGSVAALIVLSTALIVFVSKIKSAKSSDRQLPNDKQRGVALMSPRPVYGSTSTCMTRR